MTESNTTGFTKIIPVDEKDKEIIPKKYRFVKTIDIVALDYDQAKEMLSEMSHIEHYEDLTEDFAFPLKKTLRCSKEDLEEYDEYDQGFECNRCGEMEFGTALLSSHQCKIKENKE